MKSLGDLLKDERVCARLDEIADMYQDYVNVYKRFNMERLVPLDNGRGDMRRYLMISGEEKYLLIEKDIDHCNEMSLQYSYLGDIAGTDIIMPKILHKNCQKNFEGKECSFLVFTYVEGEPLKEYLKSLIPYGLEGVEGYYTDYTEDMNRRYRAMAKELGLVISGGTDYHGANKPHISIGRGKGDLEIPYSVLDGLKERHRLVRG